MTASYRSPYRPLDIGWAVKAARDAGEPVEWLYDGSTIGPWTPASVFAFSGPLPERFVDQWSLELLPGEAAR